MPAPVVVLTGLSGAGKWLAARTFEDLGWRVVDNLPPRLMAQVIDGNDAPLCLVCDTRGGDTESLLPSLAALPTRPVLLFLDATDEELVKRFKETRRPHPLFAQAGGILPAIAAERDRLASIQGEADLVIDTTGLPPAELRARLTERFADADHRRHPLTVTVASFGFKYGCPLDADLVFDVRFLKNPFYDPTLKPRDGRDPAVEAFVLADERTECFLTRLFDLVGWSLPHYVSEGKAYLNIAIGCTGGKHRSVVVAERLARFVGERNFPVVVHHRDIGRER